MKIGIILPTFTAAAYSYNHPNFYDWYAKYDVDNNEDLIAGISALTQYVPTTAADLANPKILYTPPAQRFATHLASTRPSDTVSVLQDIDIHNGAQANYDVLFIFHEEYVTQHMLGS
jgi:hypothetical protein